ncbi:TIGR01777 family oxidoreductase [Flavobacterium oreochromis]|uniref:TIGR01777 family protein n=1 Tax=Flavobacterium columnare TaxID=996 RepID=A0A246GCA8_9FLAO|nr:TIGR01777 family oxidoreductase [Flavobacterium oreochromis]OWP78663.1 TIGR01777 family protein [Flavobacterium oreochromis]
MKVLVTGATGLVGKEVVKVLHKKKILVHYLTTSKNKLTCSDNLKGFYWDPKTKEIDPACIEEVSFIIHLAGASISKRWTSRYKQEIIESRVIPLQMLYELLKNTSHKVKGIISASAIGVYPSCIERYYMEDFVDFDHSFLSNVVKTWEESVDKFTDLEMNTCKLRIGLVLSKEGGVLSEILKPLQLDLGVLFGTGQHWQSWIHITDLARLFIFALEFELQGVYNAVAPDPVTHKEFIGNLTKLVGSPLIMLNLPKVLMKLILGEKHVLLYDSQRVSSAKIQEKGFKFHYTNIDDAFRNLLK